MMADMQQLIWLTSALIMQLIVLSTEGDEEDNTDRMEEVD